MRRIVSSEQKSVNFVFNSSLKPSSNNIKKTNVMIEFSSVRTKAVISHNPQKYSKNMRKNVSLKKWSASGATNSSKGWTLRDISRIAIKENSVAMTV